MAKILISPGYGAGWSTWCHGDQAMIEFMVKDPTLIKMAERAATVEEVEAYVKSKFPNEHACMGGWRDIYVKEIPDGTQFIVTEYDGYEGVQFNTETKWITA